MVRIVGVDIPMRKRVVVSLTYIYGIGDTVAAELCAEVGVDPNTRASDLTDEDSTNLRKHIEQHLIVEGDLRREVSQNITRKKDIKCYQGIRHSRGLPVHGQRTHTNARTRKGPKKTVAGKKKVLK